MKVDELQDGQVVRARWGRAGRNDVVWGPWRDTPLAVQQHQNRVVLVTLKGRNWAEATPDDLCAPRGAQKNAYFLVEDYYLEIEGLEYTTPSPRGRR